MSIREAIAAAMKAQSLTTYALHQKIKEKVTQTTVYRFVHNGGETTTENIEAMMKALGLTITAKPARKARRRNRQGTHTATRSKAPAVDAPSR